MDPISPRPPSQTDDASVDASSTKPTIVLVHGAWAESSSWSAVIQRLSADGFPVRAIANPLQGLAADSAHLTSYLHTVVGPVVLVGHSYGGAVITNIDTSPFEVKALVYIAGFIPTKGETVGKLAGQSTPPLPLVTIEVSTGAEVMIEPTAFRESFAGDVDEATAAVLAVVQRPANVKAVTEATEHEAFTAVPSWALITRQDQAISPALQRTMVGRTTAQVVEVDASHAVMVSRPNVVADLIESAAR
jgi:pimeloyl-ACP methyl ester carboxylesterase